MERDIPAARKSVDEPPPFLGSWEKLYLYILCYLVVLISVLYLVSRAYAY